MPKCPSPYYFSANLFLDAKNCTQSTSSYAKIKKLVSKKHHSHLRRVAHASVTADAAMGE
jgi:hypothetical protein